MTREELEARAAEIDGMSMADKSTDEISQLAEEREGITRQLAELRMKAAQEAEKRDAIANDPAAQVISKAPEPTTQKEEKRMYTYESPEYRSAFYKAMTTEKFDPDRHLNEEERAAYTAVTTDTTHGAAYVLPRTMIDRIWDLVESNHSILGDITMYRTNTILEIPYRSSISQGDAANKAETVANDDEINEFAKVTLNGKDFEIGRAHV